MTIFTRNELMKMIVIPLILGVSMTIAGCYMNDEAGLTARHASDNQAGVAHARLAAQQQQAAAYAQAQAAAEQGKTDRTMMLQNGATERLNAQAQFLLAMQAEGSRRFNVMVIFFAGLIAFGGTAALFIYYRNNPAPQRQNGPFLVQIETNGAMPQMAANRQIETVSPVPGSLMRADPRFAEHGWYDAGNGMGYREVNGEIIQQCKLLEG